MKFTAKRKEKRTKDRKFLISITLW